MKKGRASGEGVGMFERTDRGDVDGLTLAPFEEAPRDTPSGIDSELLRLCDECRRAHAQWVAYFDSLADDVVGQAPASGELARLRSVWRKALDRLRELPPVTLSGALAKQDLACMLKAWSGDDDVFEFLALTSREMSAVLCSSELDVRRLYGIRGRRNGSSRVAWLDP
jgi:hypothetical protein